MRVLPDPAKYVWGLVHASRGGGAPVRLDTYKKRWTENNCCPRCGLWYGETPFGR